MVTSPLAIRRINKNLPVPFYYQIVQILREFIKDQDLNHEREVALPSENELCDLFKVNRGTVRHALEVLEREGLIYREKGRGTFLHRRRLELDLMVLCSTTEDLKARGWEPASQLLSLARITPRPHVQRLLRLAPDQTVWEIYRLRLANQEPISIQFSFIPDDLTPGLDQKDLTASLYFILQNYYRITLENADQTIRTRASTLEEAKLLGIEEGAPVFDIARVTYDQEHQPVEYLESLWRGDRYDLHVHLQRRE
ncbi:MAG: GntR family transcriptional regulator [Omnitrophica WOR_2 bacterium]